MKSHQAFRLTLKSEPMIIVIRPERQKNKSPKVISEVEELGYTPAPIHGATQTVVAAIGDERTHANLESLYRLPQVESVLRVQKRYKLASRESHPKIPSSMRTGVEIGGDRFCLMAGPCFGGKRGAVLSTAAAVKASGASSPARRSLQAAYFPIRISRPREGRPATACPCPVKKPA